MNLSVQSNSANTAMGMTGGTLTINNTNNMQARMQRVQSRSAAKKKLNYNSREISSMIMRAAKSRNAATALSKARSKVASLQRCLKSGQYNSSEVEVAIAHAKRMVKCAQLKVNNLKAEESLKKRNEREASIAKQQQKNEVKRRVRQKEKELEQEANIEEMQQVMKQKANRQELMRKRRMHRNQERSQISEAEMKYLQDQMNRNGNAYTSTSGVSLEIGSTAMSMSELQLSEHAMQLLENQIEAEVAQEMSGMDMSGISGMDGAGAVGSSYGASSGAAASASTASVGAAVDVSI